MCLQYAAATQWLISSSIVLHSPDEPKADSIGTKQLKSTTRNAAVTDSIL